MQQGGGAKHFRIAAFMTLNGGCILPDAGKVGQVVRPVLAMFERMRQQPFGERFKGREDMCCHAGSAMVGDSVHDRITGSCAARSSYKMRRAS